MTPFHLPSIRSRVASTAQPGRWAKFRRFIADFPIVSKQGLIPRIYSTCQVEATPTLIPPPTGGMHEGRRIPEIAADRGRKIPDRFRDRKTRTQGPRHPRGREGDL